MLKTEENCKWAVKQSSTSAGLCAGFSKGYGSTGTSVVYIHQTVSKECSVQCKYIESNHLDNIVTILV